MPLSKQANRDRMRIKRANDRINRLHASNNTGVVHHAVQPNRARLKPLEPPLYNSVIHRAGDVVKIVQRGKLITIKIPELDEEGNAVPEF